MKYYRLLPLLFFGSLMAACGPQAEKETEPPKPNVVMIISDDQGWGDYSFMGHESIETPHIDRLASRSLTFTRGYVTAPLCSPSLATLITGLYPHQHHITGNDPVFQTEAKNYTEEWLAARKVHFDTLIDHFQDLPLLTKLLSEEGYLNFQTGKWWLGSYEEGGFDAGMTHGLPSQGGRHGDFGLEIGREGMDTLYSFIDMAQTQQKPFFLWYAPFLPHSPHNPPDSLLQKYLPTTDSEAVARYRANCEWFDLTVGQLVQHLEKEDLAENTIFVYVCDNGWAQRPDRINRYLPGSKRAPQDMGIRTPIMVGWPGHINPEMDTTTLASSVDIVPTILDLLDIPQPPEMPGLSLTDRQALRERGHIFSEVFFHDIESVQEPTNSLKYRVVVDGEWKLILPSQRNLPDSTAQLYHITADPFEQDNLIGEYPEKAEALLAKINDWWKPDFE